MAVDLPPESFELRYQAYREVLSAHDLPFEPAYVRARPSNIDTAVAAARSLLTLPTRPTAIFLRRRHPRGDVYLKRLSAWLAHPGRFVVVGFDIWSWHEC